MTRVQAFGASILLAISALSTGCDQYLGAGIVVDNKTGTDLHFSVLLEQGWYEPVAHAPPRGTATVLTPSVMSGKQCTAGGMIAYAADGEEVARHDSPLCIGDRWVIDVIPSSEPSSGSRRSDGASSSLHPD